MTFTTDAGGGRGGGRGCLAGGRFSVLRGREERERGIDIRVASTPSTCLWVDVDDQLFKEVVCGMSGRGRESLEGGDYFSLAGLGGVASRPLLERDSLLCLMCIFKLACGLELFSFLL